MHNFAVYFKAFKPLKHFSYILVLLVLTTSCSDFQKALKSEDTAEKFKIGTELFEKEKWSKSFRLLDQIIKEYRGKPQGEKLTFMHATASYKMGDYYKSSYFFERFGNAYPKSEKSEEAAFLEAKGYYHISPRYSREQKETVEALEKFQLFVNEYPDSKFLLEANALVKELDFKLEKKAFEIAKQYDLIRDYKASVKSFNNFLLDFPGTSLRNEALFYRYDAAYNLAINSYDYLKKERINTAIDYYNALKKAFPESEYLEDANKMKEVLHTELKTFTPTTVN